MPHCTLQLGLDISAKSSGKSMLMKPVLLSPFVAANVIV